MAVYTHCCRAQPLRQLGFLVTIALLDFFINLRKTAFLINLLHWFFSFRASDLLDQLRRKAQFLRHNHVLFMFGDDFRFHQAGEWNAQLKNLTKIFDFMNDDKTMHVQVGLLWMLFVKSLQYIVMF